MFFKLTKSNPYRDFVRNARRIALNASSNQTKLKDYSDLYALLSPRMFENERLLNVSPAFSSRCEHWNQRDVSSIRPVRTVRNPWIAFKREFETALERSSTEGSALACEAISRSLGWFYACEHRDDWICD